MNPKYKRFVRDWLSFEKVVAYKPITAKDVIRKEDLLDLTRKFRETFISRFSDVIEEANENLLKSPDTARLFQLKVIK